MTAVAVVVYYHRYQQQRVMYVYYIKVRYCNKELQLSLRRPAAHIIIINNNIIITKNNNMAVAINLLLSRTIDDGGGGGIPSLSTCRLLKSYVGILYYGEMLQFAIKNCN